MIHWLKSFIDLLDRYKSVAQCKRWFNLMSHPSFVSAFLSRLNGGKHYSPIHQHSLLDSSGVEFLGRLSSSTEPLTPLFERIMSCHGLETKPDIIGSYNDLILCSVSILDQHDYFFVQHDCYFICNPCTSPMCSCSTTSSSLQAQVHASRIHLRSSLL